MSGTTIPIVLGPAGMIPAAPADVQTALIANVATTNPGYTANLPGTLIEDISSTDVAAILACNSALVELVNSITPYGANEFILNQLGQIYGVQRGQATNTSVYVVFTGSPGFVIAVGFVVSDGTYQYTIQDGGIIPTSGVSSPLYCLATQSGSWAVPANTVTSLATSVPSTVTLAVNNPSPGTPSAGSQSIDDYRSQVLQAGLAASMGMARYLRTLLGNVSGVQNRLVSVVQSGTNWKIIVGGGDPYQVAYAIYSALFDISTLVGSSTTIRNQTVNINDYPNTYSVVYVVPPVQSVSISLTWNTTSTNAVSATSMATLGSAALVQYINSIPVGAPMNLFELQNAFQIATANVLQTAYLTRMVFSVYINSTLTPPASGTGVIAGDPESYFLTDSTLITITQG